MHVVPSRHILKQQSVISCGLATAILLTIVHIHVTTQGAGYAGVLLVFDHLFNVGLVLALLILCSAVGFWILACFRYNFDKPLEALLFSLAIGCGVISVSILVVGFLSGLRPMILTGLMALWVFLARRQI